MTDRERRHRLAVRHALTPGSRVSSPEAATAAMTVLHSTEPATVHLSCWARVAGLAPGDVERALYEDRCVLKQLAMRRTLFVFPRDLLPTAWGSASARVAGTERAKIAKDVERSGIALDGNRWLDRALTAVLAALAEVPEGLPAAEIRAAVPQLDVRITGLPDGPLAASRVLTQLAAAGEIVRGTNGGPWYTSRPRWTLTRNWLDEVPEPWTDADGYRELVRRWLGSFGPGTEDDIVWWLGSTRTAVRAALAELDAVPVSLDRDERGWLLPDDVEEVPDPGRWVALLPVLDPTVMGWKGRHFLLGAHRERLFDTRGNAGTTAWVDGRAVGCWVQDAAGTVQVRLLEPVDGDARRALDAEAVRLTDWLGGLRVGSVYHSPAMSVDVGAA